MWVNDRLRRDVHATSSIAYRRVSGPGYLAFTTGAQCRFYEEPLPWQGCLGYFCSLTTKIMIHLAAGSSGGVEFHSRRR